MSQVATAEAFDCRAQYRIRKHEEAEEKLMETNSGEFGEISPGSAESEIDERFTGSNFPLKKSKEWLLSEENGNGERKIQPKEVDARRIKEQNRFATIQLLKNEPDLFDKLQKRRHELIGKEFSATITKAETIEMKSIEWQLDRIEDALVGEKMDQVYSIVEENRKAIEQMVKYSESLKAHGEQRSGRKKNARGW